VLAVNIAGATAWASHPLQPIQFLSRHLPARHGSHSHKHIGQINQFVVQSASQHRPAADHDGWDVETRSGHQHAGDDFVTVRDEYQSIEGVGLSHNFHRVSDEFAAGQGKLHAQVIHGYAIAHADSGTLKGRAAGRADASLYRVGNLAQMDMAWNDFIEGIDHPNKGLVYLSLRTAQRPQQRTMGCPLHASSYNVASHCSPLIPKFSKKPSPKNVITRQGKGAIARRPRASKIFNYGLVSAAWSQGKLLNKQRSLPVGRLLQKTM
jgi:hypothetical protein